jgi:alpha-D-ribose 1-methylphosphonate 5-triphosphate synthase subunit PhnG
MLRGRIAGEGARFNLGEATVTRASLRLASGEVGASYILGRDGERARLAALVDALWQRADLRDAVEAHVLQPSRNRQDAERQTKAARTAATKVDFFTLVRGEDDQ